MPKKKQVFEPENLESIRSAISGLIVEPPETIEPVVYSVDLLSRHDPYYPMVQGEATSRLAMTATRNMAINPITGDAVIEDEGFRAFFEGYDGLKIGLTVGAQKLLSTAALYLTQNNHYRPEESARIETEVQIPLISYARLLGYPVDERETATPEEAEKEKRRIKNLMKDVRGKINDQLDVLYSLSLSWSEKKGRVSDYQDVRLLQRKGVKRGMISIQFSDDIARYLLCSYVMQYPEALLSIDERSPRAYRLQAGVSQLRAPQHRARHRRHHFRFGAAGCVRRHPRFRRGAEDGSRPLGEPHQNAAGNRAGQLRARRRAGRLGILRREKGEALRQRGGYRRLRDVYRAVCPVSDGTDER